MVYNKEIPPLTNFKKENDKIDFKHSPFYINTELKKYESDIPFRAAVSSFGIGGTNGHVIMEEFKADEAKRANRSCYLIPVSARDEQDLRSSCENLAEYLSEHRETDIADIEKTLQCGRKAFEKRIAFVVKEVIGKTEMRSDGRKNLIQRQPKRYHFRHIRSSVILIGVTA